MAQANAPALPWIRRQGDQPDENHREQRRTHPALIALGVSTAILAVLALIFFLSAAAWKDDAVKGGQDVATAKAAEKAAKAKTVEWEKYAGQLEQKVKTAEGARDEWKNTARERGISLATVEKERDGLRSKLAAAQKARTATAGQPQLLASELRASSGGFGYRQAGEEKMLYSTLLPPAFFQQYLP